MGNRAGLQTPAVVVDVDRLDRNIARMQAFAGRTGVQLHPHIKTHKSLEIARRQVAAGAAGVTASKPTEAAVFVGEAAPVVTVAYPLLTPAQYDVVIDAAANSDTRLRFIVDSEPTIEAASAAARRHRTTLECFLKVDVGLGRVGVRPGEPEAVDTARRLRRADGLSLAGLLSHAGHAYAASGPEGIRAVATEERRLLGRLAAEIELDTEAAIMSVGCTPTALAEDEAGVSQAGGVTEIRPGNYVFLDLTAVRLGVASIEDIAIFIVTTVVGQGRDHVIVDAGSKVLSTDLGPHGMRSGSGYGLAFPVDRFLPVAAAGERPSIEGGWPVERLSEEHGFVRIDGAAPPVGTRLAIVPNHSCSVANLAPHLDAMSRDGAHERWAVDAKGLIT